MSCKKVSKSVQVVEVFQQRRMVKNMEFKDINALNVTQIFHQKEEQRDYNKPSYTITGSGGGGIHGYHYEEFRALTNRERARIQTFTDTFEFKGKKESVRRQIGMAVSPKMAQIIFESILKTFAKIEYDSVEANL